jgi:hypothetical protein
LDLAREPILLQLNKVLCEEQDQKI